MIFLTGKKYFWNYYPSGSIYFKSWDNLTKLKLLIYWFKVHTPQMEEPVVQVLQMSKHVIREYIWIKKTTKCLRHL